MSTREAIGICCLMALVIELQVVAAVDVHVHLEFNDRTVGVELVSNYTHLSHVLRKRDFDVNRPGSNGPFGVLTWKQGQKEKVCEGALIGSRHVVTVENCEPWFSGREPVTDLVFEWEGRSWSVQDVYVVPGEPYIVMLLSVDVRPPYAILSWFGDDQAEVAFNIKPELVAGYPFTLSNAQRDLPAQLNNCIFKDESTLMVLSCPSSIVPDPMKTTRDGSAFYKYLNDSKEYVVVGLINSATTASATTVLRAPRLTRRSISKIMSVAKSIGGQGATVPEGTDHIPTGTVIGTFNMQGFANQKRDLGGDVVSTLCNVFKEAHITAVQETSRLDEYPQFVSSLAAKGLSFVPSSGNSHQMGFVINSKMVEPGDCRTSNPLPPAVVTFYACNFKLGSSWISIYNVHLKAGDSVSNVDTRNKQIQELKKAIQVDPKCMPVYLIAGDMNTKDVRELKKNLISQLPDMRHHEPGITTPGGRHYDRILVSDSLRVVHHFAVVPSKRKKEQIEETFHQFFPTLSQGRIVPKHRNFELSDHLPLQYHDTSIDVKFGT